MQIHSWPFGSMIYTVHDLHILEHMQGKNLKLWGFRPLNGPYITFFQINNMAYFGTTYEQLTSLVIFAPHILGCPNDDEQCCTTHLDGSSCNLIATCKQFQMHPVYYNPIHITIIWPQISPVQITWQVIYPKSPHCLFMIYDIENVRKLRIWGPLTYRSNSHKIMVVVA